MGTTTFLHYFTIKLDPTHLREINKQVFGIVAGDCLILFLLILLPNNLDFNLEFIYLFTCVGVLPVDATNEKL